jgi:biofilm PGA synthesis N-glycosyltransferase PgaC
MVSVQMSMIDLYRAASAYLFLYPVIMSYIWIGGSLVFFISRELFFPQRGAPLSIPGSPATAILVACYNEEARIEETLRNLEEQSYSNLEIIAINDGSSDATGDILKRLAAELPRVRAIDLDRNRGKATALRTAHAATAAEYVIVVDADILLEPDVAERMVYRLSRNPRLGAVTGNPRIRNRGALLTRIQCGEFSSVVGMIKRAQSAYGWIFTVSGCIAGFRHAALQEVNYWSTDMATEDVDISWRLQLAGWLVEYEPAALCWVLMPETLGGLWKQRLRWSQGGAEVLLRYFTKVLHPRAWMMWPLYIDFFLSLTWVLLLTMSLCVGMVGMFVELPAGMRIDGPSALRGTHIMLLTFLLQSAIALMVDRRYEKGLGKQIFWMIWYPLGYWVITASTSLIGFFRALMRTKGKGATWVSPDRGVMR